MSGYLIAGNWKMNTTLPSARSLAQAIVHGFDTGINVDVVLFPPNIFLQQVHDIVHDVGIFVGAQNCSPIEFGAYTGEMSIEMAISAGCTYVLAGHSERRSLFNESDAEIAEKVHSILNKNLVPILCIGEHLTDRQSGNTWALLAQQLDSVLSQIQSDDLNRIVIAYEPVWAIGTGVTATPNEAQEAHKFIRQHFNSYIDASNIKILYGGSVNAKNAKSLLELPDVNGVLVGGASLKSEEFLSIINSVPKLLTL